MPKERLYTRAEVLGILLNLVNGIWLCEKEETVPTRYKQKVSINNQERWVTGKTLKDLLESYLDLCIKEGTVLPGFLSTIPNKQNTPILKTYMDQYIVLYKNDQESLTKESRRRIIKNHIYPKFGSMVLSDISINDIQEWINALESKGYSHETLLKIKNVFSPCLDAAVEDGYIQKNPFKSSRLKIGGVETQHHRAISSEKMFIVRNSISTISDLRLKEMLSLLSYTGMRMEEILGLRWEDIDFEDGWIMIQRAVVHPKRNQPEIKSPKSKASIRKIPLANAVKKALVPRFRTGFILHKFSDPSREIPMSYTEARNLFNKIRNNYDLKDYSAHDFRDTCATEWREAGIPTDIVAKLLGHSKSDITETRYVKYRDEIYQGVRAVMNNQNGNTL